MRNALVGPLFFLLPLLAAAQDDADELYPRVQIQTSVGSFVVELDSQRAPLTTANFLSYVRDGYYSGTIFHRVIDGFVAQGGGFTTDYEPKEPPRTGRRGIGALAKVLVALCCSPSTRAAPAAARARVSFSGCQRACSRSRSVRRSGSGVKRSTNMGRICTRARPRSKKAPAETGAVER